MEHQHYCLICYHPIAHRGAECQHCLKRASSGLAPPTVLFVGSFLAMAALFLATRALTSAYYDTRSDRRLAHMGAAGALADTGEYAEAVDEYRSALLYGRADSDVRFGLAQALFHLDQFSEARNHLIDLLGTDPTNAVVNRLLGKIAAREGRIDEAAAYFRTAIFGRWSDRPEEHRLSVRFELIEVLEKGDQALQAIGELVELLEETPDDAVRARVARHLLDAGAPERAATVFLELTRSNPRAAPAFQGLGDAEFARAHYLSARTAFARSLSLDSKNAQVLERLKLCNAIVELDPTFRSVGTRERYRRSEELAGRALEQLLLCPELPDDLAPLAERAEKLDGSIPKARAEESTEQNISLAEELWAARSRTCPQVASTDIPLRLVLEKLSE
jgi:predicted Zn-dependent protease